MPIYFPFNNFRPVSAEKLFTMSNRVATQVSVLLNNHKQIFMSHRLIFVHHTAFNFVDSVELNTIFVGFLGTQRGQAPSGLFWFGLNDSSQEGNWRWSSTGLVTTYYEWDPSQPDNNPEEDYGCLKFPVIKWHDCYDNVLLPFICEI